MKSLLLYWVLLFCYYFISLFGEANCLCLCFEGGGDDCLPIGRREIT